MPRKKKQAKHKTCLIYILIWYLIIFLNLFLLFAIPFTKSVYSFAKMLLIFFALGIIASVCLYSSLKESFKKNIIYVYIIFILLTTVPLLMILMNVLIVKLDENKMSLFEPYKYSCSMYHKQKNFEIWLDENSYWYKRFNITKEMFETFKLKRGFSSDYLHLRKRNISSDDINIGDVVLYKYQEGKGRFTGRVLGKESTGNITYILLSKDNNRIYYEGINEENVYAKLEETFRSKLFRVFARDVCFNVTSIG